MTLSCTSHRSQAFSSWNKNTSVPINLIFDLLIHLREHYIVVVISNEIMPMLRTKIFYRGLNLKTFKDTMLQPRDIRVFRFKQHIVHTNLMTRHGIKGHFFRPVDPGIVKRIKVILHRSIQPLCNFFSISQNLHRLSRKSVTAKK